MKDTYTQMYKNQTVMSVRNRVSFLSLLGSYQHSYKQVGVIFLHFQVAKWCSLKKCKMGMMEALLQLDNIIDESDPDVSQIFNL